VALLGWLVALSHVRLACVCLLGRRTANPEGTGFITSLERVGGRSGWVSASM